MNDNVFCLIALLLSVVTLIGSVCVSVFLRNKERRESKKILLINKEGYEAGNGKTAPKTAWRSPVSPFQLFLVGFSFALFFAWFPVYYLDEFAGEIGYVRIIKSILLTLYGSIVTFLAGMDYELVQGLLGQAHIWTGLSIVYTLYAALLFVVTPILTAGVVLSFFKDVSARITYTLRRKGDVYILSALNERSIVLAEDVLGTQDKRRKTVVFTGIDEKGGTSELVARAKRMGAICMKKKITQIGLKHGGTDNARKLYFIGEVEDENVKQALTVLNRCYQDKRYDNPCTQFYVFSFANNPESEILINSANNGNMKVRRVNENNNLALRTLRAHNVFHDAVGREGDKKLNIVIVGLGGYGIGFLKTLCWCGQMPGYTVHLHVFDKGASGEQKLGGVAPELIRYNGDKTQGEPYYQIHFYNKVDVHSADFEEKLGTIKDVTTAFVTLGDDGLNVATALKMRTVFGRKQIEKGWNVPRILPVVYSDLKNCALAGGENLKDFSGNDYGIRFIGAMRARYTVKAIEQLGLEADGLACHLFWVNAEKMAKLSEAKTQEEKDKVDAWFTQEEARYKKKYEDFEYYRRSSIAQAMYAQLRQELGIVPGGTAGVDEVTITEWEHKRWSMFMRSEGYVGAKERSDIAKTHPRLVYEETLSVGEWNKDALIVGAKLKENEEETQ